MNINKLILESLSFEYPDILYHGSSEDFDKFSTHRFGYGSGDGGWLGKGIYITNDIDYAKSYALPDGILYTVQVDIKNPLILTDSSYSKSPTKLHKEYNVNNSTELTNLLLKKGYDSVMLHYFDEYINSMFYEICVFNSSSIKILDKKYL